MGFAALALLHGRTPRRPDRRTLPVEEDGLTPSSDAQAMQQAIPGSRLVQIPGVGHLSNLEAPEAFNEAVDEFLSPQVAFGEGGGGGGPW